MGPDADGKAQDWTGLRGYCSSMCIASLRRGPASHGFAGLPTGFNVSQDSGRTARSFFGSEAAVPK
jgi:hypothetical protein